MESGSVFEHVIEVARADIDTQGHVNNVVFLRYIQDIALAHWRAVSTPEQRAANPWVVRRHEIDYLRPALCGDSLTVRTWIRAIKGATTERMTEIHRPRDNQTLVSAQSLWVLLDPVTRRPRRADAGLRRLFGLHL